MAAATSVRLFYDLFQEPVYLIELGLKLCESRQLNIELLAHLGELVFDNGEDVRSSDGWSGRALLAACAWRAANALRAAAASFASTAWPA